MSGKLLIILRIIIVLLGSSLCEDNFEKKTSALLKTLVYRNSNFIEIYNNKLTKAFSEDQLNLNDTETNRKQTNRLGTSSFKNQLATTALVRSPGKPSNNMVIENEVESQLLTISNNSSSNGYQQNSLLTKTPGKGNVIDWFLGVVGIRPPPDTNPPAVAPVKTCSGCFCGELFRHRRIVGGIETMVNEYPWMTALLYNNRFYCGASLINNKYVLSAAHCVNGFSIERITAVFLDHDRSNVFETQTLMRKLKNIMRHRSYGNGGNYNNDIALLQLDQEVPLTGTLKPVCLPPTGRSFTGHNGIATGWGATKEHGQISNKLREVRVPIMSNIECRRTGYGYRITDNMLCAGFPDGQKDSCQGDSGGPLHIVNGSFHQLVGIVSWGEGCAQANYPGVYTRVNRYISWIKSNTRDACYCPIK